MFTNGIWLRLLTLCVCVSEYVLVYGIEINMTKYYQLPPIFEFDDYDRCLNEHPKSKSIYCYADVTLKPNISLDSWKYIETLLEKPKLFYRHDRLKRGICINWCKHELKDIVKIVQRGYLQPKSEMIVNDTTSDQSLYRNAMHDRYKYNRFINICINWRLKHKYGYMAYSEIEYCVTSKSSVNNKFDNLDRFCICVIVIIIACVLISTFYDYRLKFPKKNENHYKLELMSIKHQILTSFSISRNWEKIMKDSNPEEMKILTSIKAFFITGIVLTHVLLTNIVLPVANTEFIESNMARLSTVLILNGSQVMQCFLAISGFLVGYNFFKCVKKDNIFKPGYGFVAVIHRYFRFIPTYLLVLLLHSTLLSHFQSGPVWPYVTESERNACRKNWWTNFLFINNYINSDEPCMQHAWYLAVDFQLFISSILLLIIMWKFPRTIYFIFIITIASSFLIVAFVTYIYGFDGADMHTVEDLRKFNLKNEMYYKMYIPAHTSFGNYWFGILGGYLYLKLQNSGIDPKTLKHFKLFKLAWWTFIPIQFGIVLNGYLFRIYDFEKPSLWIAIYASFSKHCMGFFTTAAAFGFFFNFGGFLRKILIHKLFIILGRISFSVYILHTYIVRTAEGNLLQPQYLSDIYLIIKATGNIGLCFITGFILTLFVEYPFANLENIICQLRNNKCELRSKDKPIKLEQMESYG